MRFGAKIGLTALATTLATVAFLEARKRRAASMAAPQAVAWDVVGIYESLVWRPPDSLPWDTQPPEGTKPNGWVKIQIRTDATFITRWDDRRSATPRTGSFAGTWERRGGAATGPIGLVTTLSADGAPSSDATAVEIAMNDDGSLQAPGVAPRLGSWIPGSSTRYRRIP